jgi:signal transduction histidine kinase
VFHDATAVVRRVIPARDVATRPGEKSGLVSATVPRAIALRHQLFVALVVPAVLVVALTAALADVVARRALEEALGERLVSIAQSGATLVGAQVLLLERGEDDFRSKKNALSKLNALREATGVERILIVRLEGAQAIVDTTDELKIGDEYTRARFDATELEAIARGSGIASVLFEGPDGRPYKTGYAPLRDDEGAKIQAFVAVNARASFYDAIDELRRTLAIITLVGFAGLIALALLVAKRVSVPLSALSSAAERIGQGKLDTEIPSDGPEEAVVLSTTMRSMTRSLAARDEELQMMLAGIAHEVRNPLGGIELFGGLLREDLEDGDPRRKHVDKILKELGTLARVVNDFLDFARRTKPAPRLTDLRDLLEEVVSLAAKDARTHEVEITLDASKDVAAELDPEAIKRAVLNLVRNGIQAVPKGGKVRVSARRAAGRIQISVEDDGPGIPAEKRAEIFTPFYTTKQKGTGLGLALVKKTIDAHHGAIHVGEAEGGGAKLTIELPESQPA